MKALEIYATAEAALDVIGFKPADDEYQEIIDTMQAHAEKAGVTVPDNVLASIHVASMDDQDAKDWQALCVAAANNQAIAFDEAGNFTINGYKHGDRPLPDFSSAQEA